jgi:hypothetical protein
MKKTLWIPFLFALFTFVGCSGGKDCNNCPKPTPTQPTTCTMSVQPLNQTIPCEGGKVTFTVTKQGSCPAVIVVNNNSDWLTVVIGSDNSSATATGTANNTGSSRTGTSTVAGQVVTITQPACSVTPQTCQDTSADNNGGSLPCSYSASSTKTATVTETVNCSSGGTSNGSATGTGNATGYSTISKSDAQSKADAQALANAQADTVAKAAATATAQANCPAPQPCTYTMPAGPPAPYSAGAGLNGFFTLNTQAGCSRTAESGTSWVHVTSGSSGTGSGSVGYSLDPNPNMGGVRTGRIVATGVSFTGYFTIEQNGQ